MWTVPAPASCEFSKGRQAFHRKSVKIPVCFVCIFNDFVSFLTINNIYFIEILSFGDGNVKTMKQLYFQLELKGFF